MVYRWSLVLSCRVEIREQLARDSGGQQYNLYQRSSLVWVRED